MQVIDIVVMHYREPSAAESPGSTIVVTIIIIIKLPIIILISHINFIVVNSEETLVLCIVLVWVDLCRGHF